MILAFASDSTVCVFDTITQANCYCEAIDVENGEYAFIDESGRRLIPSLVRRADRGGLFGIRIVEDGTFTLESTDEIQFDLLRRLQEGAISVDRGPTAIRSTDELVRVAPRLFREQTKPNKTS